MIFVAAAGPASNLIMATIWAAVIAVLIYVVPVGGGGELLRTMARYGVLINVSGIVQHDSDSLLDGDGDVGLLPVAQQCTIASNPSAFFLSLDCCYSSTIRR
jgi:hypothetical protein